MKNSNNVRTYAVFVKHPADTSWSKRVKHDGDDTFYSLSTARTYATRLKNEHPRFSVKIMECMSNGSYREVE